MSDQSTIAIIGLGGIGSWLVEPLLRYVKSCINIKEIILIDGDNYSVGNQTRQCIHPRLIGMNKASATALRMRQYFPEIQFREVTSFINEENISSIFDDVSNLIIFNCCDNNYCRKIVSEFVYNNKRSSIVLFSGGNELTDGNSHIQKSYYGSSSETLLVSHPEVKDALPEEDRGRMSCQQLANLPSSSQVIVTNFWVASIMLQQLYLYLNGKLLKETFFDIKTSSINAIKQPA